MMITESRNQSTSNAGCATLDRVSADCRRGKADDVDLHEFLACVNRTWWEARAAKQPTRAMSNAIAIALAWLRAAECALAAKARFWGSMRRSLGGHGVIKGIHAIARVLLFQDAPTPSRA
jgi:hypothetical protein